MTKPKYVKKMPKRTKQVRPRRWTIDFRSIKGSPPNKRQLKNLKKFYRSYRGNKPTFSYHSPEQMQAEVDQYFESCYGPLIDKKTGKPVYNVRGEIIKTQVEPFTVAGLAYYIGMPTMLLNRITWGYYDDLDETTENDLLFSSILKRAKQKIAMYSEKRLFDKDGFNGAKFVLDHHFHSIGQRESAEIMAIQKNLEYKEQELEIKKQMLDIENEDSDINIIISRKED